MKPSILISPDALAAALAAAQTPIPDDALMTTPQAAAYLGVRPSTLVDYRQKCLAPVYVKLHGNVRYLKSDLDALIQSCRQGR